MTHAAPPPHRFAAFWAETRALLALALPMMVAQIAQTATGFVDTVMAGQVGAEDLAAVSIGTSILLTVFLTLSGVVMAVNPLVSQQFGAGEHQAIGATVRQGLWTGLGLGLLGVGLMFAAQQGVSAWMTLDPAVEAKTRSYLTGATLGVPAIVLYRVLHAYSSSVNRTRPIMVISVLALLLNIPLNSVLIYGQFGLPALGGAGCGWATGIVFWFSLLALAGWTYWHPAYQSFAVWSRWTGPHWAQQRTLLRLGLPIALSYFVEVSAFTSVALLIANLGAKVVAGHQVVISFTSVLYMVPLSLSVALSVRVGQAVGAGDYRAARFNSHVGLAVGGVTALLSSLLVFWLRVPIAAIYTPDPDVIALAAGLLVFAAVFQLADAAQVIASGALRGYKITTAPMLIHTLSFWGIGLGLGLWLGLGQGTLPLGYGTRPLGAAGFWWALTLSLVLAAVLLVVLLAKESRRGVRRQILLAEGGARGELATLRRGKP